MSTSLSGRDRRAAARQLADEQAGMLHRRQLYELSWTTAQIDAQIRAGRWRRTGWQTLATYTGPLTWESRAWWALLETSPQAVLAGVTALQVAGLKGLDEPKLHVAVPKSSRPRPTPGVVAHETRRLREDHIAPTVLPRMRATPAAVFAAMWAASDRQAALYLVMPEQQRLVRGTELLDEANRVSRHPRAPLIRAVASDVAGGAEALGELDFADLCRRGGLPPPTRQAVVHAERGRYYLDVRWDRWRVSVEIDGVAHMHVATWLNDAWRQNEVTLRGEVVLRFPQLAVRTDPARVLGQTQAALLRQGWRP
jgi:hypothetical protein